METTANTTISSNNLVIKDDTIGIVGFVLAILGFAFCWVPFVKWILLIPAFTLSIIATKRNPQTLTMIGAILSGYLLCSIYVAKFSIWGGLLSLFL